MIAHPNQPEPNESDLREIMLQIVCDFAPRNITLGHADRMADCLTGLILAGAVVTVKEQPENGGFQN